MRKVKATPASPAVPPEAVVPAARSKKSATQRQLRGSSLLLAGRFLAKGINFAVKILIVRFLAKEAYGAFAYALAIVDMGTTFVTFGLDRAVTRFVPIYEEEGDYDRMFGTIVMVFGTILALGLATLLMFYGFQQQIAASFIDDRQAFALLLILISLAPVQALDTLLEGMFAVFSNPKAIFFRKYLLGPILKLVVVLLLIVAHANVEFLATGYLIAGIVGITLYTIILFKTMHDEGVFRTFNIKTIKIPARAVLAFTVPLLSSDLVYVVMNTVDVILLEYFYGTVDVAAVRAVEPTAKMNQIVLASFALLFTPLAARMFANKDRGAINDLYWQNAVWAAIATFPVFALTFSLAEPITVLLYGERYASSAVILALLSCGYYYNAALGQNGLTLKVFGKVRYVVAINVFVALLNLVLNLILIPRFGAVGAAVGTFATLMVFNTLKQAGLGFDTGINLFDARYRQVYISIAIAAGGLLAVQVLLSPQFYVSFALAAIASLGVFRINRAALNVDETFPELLKLPFAKYIFGEK